MSGLKSHRLTERRVERLLSDREVCEPPAGLLDQLRAEIPPPEALSSAPLRAALADRGARRIRLIPPVWLAAASITFAVVGAVFLFRVVGLRQAEERAAAPAPPAAAPALLSPSPSPLPPAAKPGPGSPPVDAVPAPEPVQPLGVEPGAVGGLEGPDAQLQFRGSRERDDAPAVRASPEGSQAEESHDREAAPEPVPETRDPWAVLRETQGVLADRTNAGGRRSGQQSSYSGPGEAPDGKGGAVAAPGRTASAPPAPPPPPPAEERPRPASRAAEAPQTAAPSQAPVPYGGDRGVNRAAPAPAPVQADLLLQRRSTPPETRAPGPRVEAANLPWRTSGMRLVIGLDPAGGSALEKPKVLSGPGAESRQLKRDESARAEAAAVPALELRFEPNAVVRARWLGEGAWREPGTWENLTGGKRASARLEVDLRPGVHSEQVVAFTRTPEAIRALRLADVAGAWERISWETRAAILRSELEMALRTKTPALSEAETAALVAQARAAAAARPADPRAVQIARLADQVEEGTRLGAAPEPP